jgi:hypothetical protein
VRVIDLRMYGSAHLREDMLDAVVAAHPEHPFQPTHTRPASSSSSANAQSPSDEDGPQASNLPTAVNDGEVMTIPDFEKEKARDLKLRMGMFGDDARHWGARNPQKMTFLSPRCQTSHPMSKWRR